MNRDCANLEYQIPAQGTQNPILEAKRLLQKKKGEKLLCIFNKWENKTSPSQDYLAKGTVIKVCGNKCTIRFTKTENAISRLFGDTKKRVRDVQEDEGGPVKSSKH
jgi:ribosomal protein L35AE/L33A